MRPTFDDKDQALLDARIIARDAIDGPRIGDWLKLPTGDYVRFTHDWGDDIQTTIMGWASEGGFYLSKGGYASFSGGLDPALPKAKMSLTEEVKEGVFWFFHHDHSGAHRGVYCKAPCRVYQFNP